MGRRLLLLNASNYPRNAIYPYAFVQVSALARRHGLTVVRADLMLCAKDDRQRHVGDLIARHRPDLVGLHLRQCDSQFIEEYDPILLGDRKADYFPLTDTRDLIAMIRNESDAPIVVGGFGVTNDPIQIFQFLKPDFAVEGEPDAFFARCDDILSGRLAASADVANLIRAVDGTIRRGPRVFFPPNPQTEYTDEVVDDLERFYSDIGRTVSVDRLGEVDIPVEISRGCPYACAFCTEPHVKSGDVRYRNLDTVITELEFLATRKVRGVWFVCSELNIANSDFAMTLAERMIRFNEARPGGEVSWKAYSLPRPVLRTAEWDMLARSGYIPGWNGVTSFSDPNLRRMRVPYRTRDAVNYLKEVARIEPTIRAKTGSDILKVELFLGNMHADATTIRDSLRAIGEHALFERYQYKEIIRGTRLYRSTRPALGVTDDTSLKTYGQQPDEPRYLSPTFAYAPALLDHFGSAETICDFFAFLENNLFAPARDGRPGFARGLLTTHVAPGLLASVLRGHVKYRIFASALFAETTDGHVTVTRSFRQRVVARVGALMSEASDEAVAALYDTQGDADEVKDAIADVVVSAIRAMSRPAFSRLLESFGLVAQRYSEGGYSQYQIFSAIYRLIGKHRDFESGILARLNEADRAETQFLFLWLLEAHGVQLRPKFRFFFQ